MNYFDLLFAFKKEQNATIVGVRKKGHKRITVNAAHDEQVIEGDSIYYIATSRILNPSFS